MKQLIKLMAALLVMVASAANATTFTLESNGGNGFVTGSFPGFTLVSADYGEGGPGTGILTTYTGTISYDQTMAFSYVYTTNDVDGAALDPAGYILNGVQHQLSPASSPQYFTMIGSTSVALHAGDNFGWYVNSLDSKLGTATLTVIASVPEPETYAMMLAGLALLGVAVRRRKQY